MVKNLISVYGAQIYSVIITIVFTPILLTLVGTDGFGLIGLFLVIQTILQILDGGISGSLSRQAALSLQNKACFNKFKYNITVLQILLITISILVFGISMLIYREGYFYTWFNSNLDQGTVNTSLLLMIATICLKYIGLVSRSVIIGLEKHKAISFINLTVATLRYPGAVMLLSYLDNDIKLYFEFQLLVTIVELLLLSTCCMAYLRKIFSVVSNGQGVESSNELSLRELFKFSGMLWLLSLTWVLISQIDKLTLVSTVSLSNFGIYTLAVTATGAMLTLGVPLNQLLMPRLTILYRQKVKNDFIKLFSISFYTYIVVFLSITMLFTLVGDKLLFVWTGEKHNSISAAKYLYWLAIGNFFAGLTNFAFLLSYSSNKLQKYSLRYITFGLIAIPCSIISAFYFHEDGAARFWLLQNLLFFTFYSFWCMKNYLYRMSYCLLYLILPVILVNYSSYKVMSLTEIFTSEKRIDGAIFLGLMISFSLVINIFIYYLFIKSFLIKFKYEK